MFSLYESLNERGKLCGVQVGGATEHGAQSGGLRELGVPCLGFTTQRILDQGSIYTHSVKPPLFRNYQVSSAPPKKAFQHATRHDRFE